ncbi:hypothetical protein AB0M47_15895 [Hamadaea sp. NPDC051192]|uniref:hypothetical protein n=1 Tax=Hamadaea sp. NPDC051192 TaxID=3154940 RepID=UPI00343B4AE9
MSDSATESDSATVPDNATATDDATVTDNAVDHVCHPFQEETHAHDQHRPRPRDP